MKRYKGKLRLKGELYDFETYSSSCLTLSKDGKYVIMLTRPVKGITGYFTNSILGGGDGSTLPYDESELKFILPIQEI